ncbi:MAG: hypothetical protein RRY73_00800 [Alistipes sp.]
MKIINVHYNTKDNISKFYLAQHTEWHFIGRNLMLYNTLFDSVVIAKPKSIEVGMAFIEALKTGCEDVLVLIGEAFDQPSEAIYSLMVNKKIIE